MSSSWIAMCRDEQQIVMPLNSMLVRSLPIKTTGRQGFQDYAVAKVAARQDGTSILENHMVHLIGRFDRPPKEDLHALLDDSGATVSSQTSSAIACLQKLNSGSDECLVLLCDDGCASLPDSLYRPMKEKILSSTKGNMAKSLLIVNPQWLFDSVVTGSALEGHCYNPKQQTGRINAVLAISSRPSC